MTTVVRRFLLPLAVALSAAIGAGALSELPRTLITVLPGELFAETIEGTATASDGDSLRIGNNRVRILGIDAPELAQSCGESDEPTACGRAARDHLARLIDGRVVSCIVEDRDRYDRLVAQCAADGRDLGDAMVEAGMAVDYERYSHGFYAEAEARARAAGVGIWSDVFVDPEDWRARQRQRGRWKRSVARSAAINRTTGGE
ncbi:thermonuclease family protein [Marinivivus vitaminiproducens]|uniref:thermonuclease family protein n=1 Tax=Marinivivus vitaminiproducens TaxID=3035935 RepID=UPI0027A4A56B|nr:thermonuclease family protein [Geminicoccaceae bacterium SCSIO 64248]